MKKPAFQFYPGDWQRDSALRACSIGARGCWLEMICIMHQATPYGHLLVNEKPIAADTLARMIGATKRETIKWLSELESSGVFIRDRDGCIVSRRMIKDEAVRSARAEGGRLGGNPNLSNDGKVGNKVNLPPNLPPTPSSSVFNLQSSTSRQKEKKSGFRFDDSFNSVWDLWKRHRIEKQKPLGETEEEQQLYELARFESDEASEIVRYSIAAGARNLITNGDHRGKQHSSDSSGRKKNLIVVGEAV